MSDLTKETCPWGNICKIQDGCKECKLTKKDADWGKGRIFGYQWEDIQRKQQKRGA